MRIIAGKYRNRTLRTGTHFRPTADRVRETLFNILQNEIEGSIFVDVFAGSGSVGIEAISRGAEYVYFIENNRRNVRVLQQNVEECCGDDRWRIFEVMVGKGLTLVAENSPRVDLIYYDPPYDYPHYTDLLENAADLFPDALHILETSSRVRFDVPAELELKQERKIGETLLSFFRRRKH